MSRSFKLLPQKTIPAEGTYVGEEISIPFGTNTVAIEAKFAYGSGGTSVKAYIQTTLDAGVTWIDIMCFAFTTSAASKVSAVRASIALAAAGTPTDGSLTDNTILDGLIGDRLRCKYIVAGTYAGASHLTVVGVIN